MKINFGYLLSGCFRQVLLYLCFQANSSNQDSPELPDSTDLRDGEKKDSAENLEDMDFDIDDIDKELEMALERKRVGSQTIR